MYNSRMSGLTCYSYICAHFLVSTFVNEQYFLNTHLSLLYTFVHTLKFLYVHTCMSLLVWPYLYVHTCMSILVCPYFLHVHLSLKVQTSAEYICNWKQVKNLSKKNMQWFHLTNSITLASKWLRSFGKCSHYSRERNKLGGGQSFKDTYVSLTYVSSP